MAAKTAQIVRATSRASFSFYLPPKPDLLLAAAPLADALCIRGHAGPKTIEKLRVSGWTGTAIFDAACYEPSAERPDRNFWFNAQYEAGADRLLTAGRWVSWDPSGDALAVAVADEVAESSGAPGSTVLLALDYRWLVRRLPELITELRSIDGPVALVLAHPLDPLGQPHAVENLIGLLRAVPQVSLLRSDHGSIGAVAYGAQHASVGLSSTYRHFVPVGIPARGKPGDRTQRVFVWDLMDWFTVATIAGWGATGFSLNCTWPCCEGRSLVNFFDPAATADAHRHNRTVLAALADDILDAPAEDRRRRFADRCAEAVARYGYMGKLSALIEPKAQLLQWASCA